MADSTKYIFVTGGVVSSLGKGLAAASLGTLLEYRGYKVIMQKFDPYLNIDLNTGFPQNLEQNTSMLDLSPKVFQKLLHTPLDHWNQLT